VTFALPKDSERDYLDAHHFFLGTVIMIKRSAFTFLFSVALVFGVGTAAGAAEDDTCGNSPQTCDTPEVIIPVDVLPSAPETAAPTATPAGPAALPKQTLPVTGSETAALAFGGLVLVAAGGALVWRSNKAAA
jgi:LPXTG-motif cell wall-anchored protein